MNLGELKGPFRVFVRLGGFGMRRPETSLMDSGCFSGNQPLCASHR